MNVFFSADRTAGSLVIVKEHASRASISRGMICVDHCVIGHWICVGVCEGYASVRSISLLFLGPSVGFHIVAT